MAHSMDPNYLGRVFFALKHDTVSLDKANEIAYAQAGPEHTNDYLTLKGHFKDALDGLSFAAFYAKKFGRKGADLQAAKETWIAHCLARTLAGLPLPPPTEEP